MQLEIYKETTSRVPAKKIRALFEMIAGHEAKPTWQAQVNLVFTSDKKIQRLNKEYRGKNKPTDVLSFNVDRPEKAGDIFGEVYVSTQTAARQARRLHHSLVDEFLRLACHGFMHLFGHDHQEDGEADKMEAQENAYLRKLAGK